MQGPHLGQAHVDLNALSLHLMNALSHLTQQRLKGERMLKALSEGECKATSVSISQCLGSGCPLEVASERIPI